MSSNCTTGAKFDVSPADDLYNKDNLTYYKCKCGTPLISLGELLSGECLECQMERAK